MQENFLDMINGMESERDKGYVDKMISLKALYEFHYGFMGDVTGSSFDSIAYLPSTKGDSLDILEGMVRKFVKLRVLVHTGLDLEKFFNLPPYMTDMIFKQCEELKKISDDNDNKESQTIAKMNAAMKEAEKEN